MSKGIDKTNRKSQNGLGFSGTIVGISSAKPPRMIVHFANESWVSARSIATATKIPIPTTANAAGTNLAELAGPVLIMASTRPSRR
jgi:hypothetical protein